ncbi:acyl carrier protein [Inquilinus limosus]|nr:acyl carrier protein [Inquilinus limosus]
MSTPTKEQIQATAGGLLANLLGVEAKDIDPHASLFGGGFNSILAVQLAAQLTETLGFDVRPDVVLRSDSLDGLSAALAAQA